MLSGGQTTTANLFGRMNSMRADRVGLVGHWDCVTRFDEVAGMRFKDTNAVQIMKDYMASGSYARGRDQINADASMVFEGNINDTVQMSLRPRTCLIRSRRSLITIRLFFDRIHYYLPGWEIPKMRSRPADRALWPDHRLPVGVFARRCAARTLRTISTVTSRFNSDFNKRDEIAVRKTLAALPSCCSPDEAMDKDDVRWLLDYAIEGRRRVKEQLKIMAGVEFIDVNRYMDADNPQDVHVVRVPEQSEDTLIPDGPLLSGHVFGG